MNIFKALRGKKYTQKELAELVNVHQTAVSQWELGSSFPDVEIIKKLSKLYGVSTDYILGLSDIPLPAGLWLHSEGDPIEPLTDDEISDIKSALEFAKFKRDNKKE